jgi:phage shock protein C
MGEYLDVDPTVVRLVTIILALATGLIPMTIGYIIAWFIIPEAPRTSPQ